MQLIRFKIIAYKKKIARSGLNRVNVEVSKANFFTKPLLIKLTNFDHILFLKVCQFHCDSLRLIHLGYD